MASVPRPPAAERPVQGRARAEGGGGDVDALLVVVFVAGIAEEAQQGGRAVELAEPAAEGGAGDEAAPEPADKRGADEARGITRREAEEDLLDELLQQLRRHRGEGFCLPKAAASRASLVWLSTR